MDEYSLLTDRSLSELAPEIDRFEISSRLKREGQKLIGMESGSAILKMADWHRESGIDFWGGIFYFNEHKTGEAGGHRQQRVVVPIETSKEETFWEWTNQEREKLADKWKVSKVAFGITGRFYDSSVDTFGSGVPIKNSGGVLRFPEGQPGDENSMVYQSKKFMLFMDSDEKHSMCQLETMANQIKTPFLVADSGRGEHFIVPFMFESNDSGLGIFEKVYAVSLLASIEAGISLDLRHFAYSLFLRERVIRVSEGLNGSAAPKISRVIWPSDKK